MYQSLIARTNLH